MKKACLIFCLVMITLFSACGEDTPTPPIGDGEEVVEPLTADITFLSSCERFYMEVFYTQIIQETKEQRVVFEFIVRNVSADTFSDFTVHLLLNEGLNPYLAAGTLVPSFGPIDLSSDGEVLGEPQLFATGVHFYSAPLILMEDMMDFRMLEAEEVLQQIEIYAASYYMQLSWNGGEEMIFVSIPMVNHIAEE